MNRILQLLSRSLLLAGSSVTVVASLMSSAYSVTQTNDVSVTNAQNTAVIAAIPTPDKPLTPEEEKNLFAYWVQLCQTYKQAGKVTDALNACDEALKLNRSNPMIWAIRSQLMAKLGKLPEAIASVDLALRLQQNNSQLLSQKCELQSQLGQPAEAIVTCEEALKINRNWGSISPNLALHYQGIALSKLGKYREALNIYNNLLSKDATSQVWLGRCIALYELGDDKEAAADCDRALVVNRDWGDSTPAIAQSYRGKALSRLGNQYTTAIETCKNIPINQLGASPAILNQCAITTQDEQYKTALNTYNQALAINPKDASLWTQQGVALAKLGRLSEALTSYDWALKFSPNYSQALVHRCAVLNKLDRYTDALAACDQALTGDGQWGESNLAYAWSQRGVALAAQGNNEEALSSLDRAQAITMNDAEIWNNRGIVLARLKRDKEAIAAFKQALALNPDYAQAWFNQGNLYKSLTQYEQALAAYDRALQGNVLIGDRNIQSDIWANKSVVQWHMGRYEDAVASAEAAIAANPSSVISWYNQAVALASLKRYTQALEAYQQAAKLEPNNAALWLAQGMMLKALKRSQTAINAFDRALSLNPKLTTAWYQKGLILSELKQYDEAIQAYSEVIKLNANHSDAFAQQGIALLQVERFSEASAAFDTALRINSRNTIARSGKALLQNRKQRQPSHQSTPYKSEDSGNIPSFLLLR